MACVGRLFGNRVPTESRSVWGDGSSDGPAAASTPPPRLVPAAHVRWGGGLPPCVARAAPGVTRDPHWPAHLGGGGPCRGFFWRARRTAQEALS